MLAILLIYLHSVSTHNKTDMNPGRVAPRPNTLASSIRIVLRIRFNDGLNDATIRCDKPIDKSVNATNDERKVEIERVIDEFVKIMQASIGREFGFYEEPVTSKIARNRPERKPI